MALAPFFDRVYGAVGGHLSVSRESLIGVLHEVVVGLSCAGLSPNDRCIAELSTNILARLYPRLSIHADDQDFSQALRQLALRINPSIELVDEMPLGLFTISVGRNCADNALSPSAAGWVARLDHGRSRESGIYNPFSASAAAAFACAELFRRIFLKHGADRDVSISLLDFSEECGQDLALGSPDIGDVAFVGVGAVGNAGIWSLAKCPSIRGKLFVVDSEALTLSNLQRYVLGRYKDVNKPKIRLAGRCLRQTGLKTEFFRGTLEDFVGRGGLEQPTVCISVDNIQGRRAAQALLPRLVINGWTGDRALGASWHVLSQDAACLACLYHPRGQGSSAVEQAAKAFGLPIDRALNLWLSNQPLSGEEILAAARALDVDPEVLAPWRDKSLGQLYTDVACGAVPLNLGGIAKMESVPLAHQSVLAGALMAAELVKRTDLDLARCSQPEPLISWDDVLRAPPRLWQKPRPRELGCFCNDELYRQVYAEKWKEL